MSKLKKKTNIQWLTVPAYIREFFFFYSLACFVIDPLFNISTSFFEIMKYVEAVDVEKSSTSLKRPKLKPVFWRFILLKIPCCAMKKPLVFYYLPAKKVRQQYAVFNKKAIFCPLHQSKLMTDVLTIT